MAALLLGQDGPPRQLAGTERRRREPGQDGPASPAKEPVFRVSHRARWVDDSDTIEGDQGIVWVEPAGRYDSGTLL